MHGISLCQRALRHRKADTLRTIAEEVLVLGFIGKPGIGKTFATERICWAAGVEPAKASAECSTPILRFVNHYRLFLLEHVHQLVEMNRDEILTWLLSHGPEWLAEAGAGLLPEIPMTAFQDIGSVSEATAGEIMANIAAVWRNPRPYLRPITVATKSTLLIRPLLSAINPAISDPACAWLRANGYPQVTNLWPHCAGLALEDIHRQHPGYGVLIMTGLRRLGDDRWVHDNDGLVVERVRPSAQVEKSHTGHLVEQGLLVPDIILGGDCEIDEVNWTYDSLRDALAVFYELIRYPDSELRLQATGRGAAGDPLYVHLPDLLEVSEQAS